MNVFWYGINFTANCLNNKALTVSLRLTNPFGQHNSFFRKEAIRGAYTGTSVTRMDDMRMQIGLSVGYRFGNLNASVKKTAARITNDDLQGRKN